MSFPRTLSLSFENWRLAAEGGMRSAGVVIAQPCRPGFGSLGRVLEGSGVEPFAQGCLDEAFGLAVGAWRIWPGLLVADAAIRECLSKEPAFVGRAVVGHDA